MDPDKHAHAQRIAKQGKRSYNDNQIMGNKQSPIIVALNGAGVIPAGEVQDVGRVLRED